MKSFAWISYKSWIIASVKNSITSMLASAGEAPLTVRNIDYNNYIPYSRKYWQN